MASSLYQELSPADRALVDRAAGGDIEARGEITARVADWHRKRLAEWDAWIADAREFLARNEVASGD